jgi:F-type H+-transporting ATPase subunit epsilon
MATLQCEVSSPEGVLYQGEAQRVVLPAADGELGVLPRHAPLIASLGAGELRIVPGTGSGGEAKAPLKFYLAGGFAQVVRNRLVILATEAHPLESMDLASAERELADVSSSRPKGKTSVLDDEAYALRLRSARAKVRILRKR